VWPANQLRFPTNSRQIPRKVIGEKWLLFVALIVIFLWPGVSAQGEGESNPDRGRILSLENAWNQALQQKDAAALRMLLAPDLFYVDYDGSLLDKAQYLVSIQVPSVHPAHIVNEAMTVHFYGGVAVVSGLCRENGTRNGKAYSVLVRFTDTWIRRSESWVCIASQSTLVVP
jgi:ketosteroid isomerase-like protein